MHAPVLPKSGEKWYYKTVDEVVKVKGIGPKTLEKIRDKVTVGETAGK